MEFSRKDQTQKAGDNAIQYQIESQNNNYSTNVTQYYGASPSEMVFVATTVYNQLNALSIKQYAEIATTTIDERINAFGCELFPRLEKVEGALEKFMDPKFEFLLREAQITAAKTDRREDLCMLSELLSCHVQKGNDKKIDAGISHAIRIVDEIDNDALCALTIACAFHHYIPTSGIIRNGLNILNELYGKLLYLDLPTGRDWLDHLDILGAVRLSSFGKNSTNEFLNSKYSKYACVGIKKESAEYNTVKDILFANNIPDSVITDNDCMDGYVRLSIIDIDDVRPEYKEPFLQIENLYSRDSNAIKMAHNKFIEIWDSYENLKKVRLWWEAIPNFFDITYIGRVLAQTNAKRMDPDLPDMI